MSADRFRLAVVVLLGALVLARWGGRPAPPPVAAQSAERYQLVQLADDSAVLSSSTRIFEPGTGKLYLWFTGGPRRDESPYLVVIDPIRGTSVTRGVEVTDQRAGR